MARPMYSAVEGPIALRIRMRPTWEAQPALVAESSRLPDNRTLNHKVLIWFLSWHINPKNGKGQQFSAGVPVCAVRSGLWCEGGDAAGNGGGIKNWGPGALTDLRQGAGSQGSGGNREWTRMGGAV